ncbi:MAG: hypothetical protein IM600_17095 [Bacteroidetes bacterium]|nr:hypothetical protein [Bacteroidota bacterium]MCA6445148.1 hypothetical protein [Bacteroidota bacterium]
MAVQWLNEHLCFGSSLVVADSFRLRNRQLLVAAKRYQQAGGQFRSTKNIVLTNKIMTRQTSILLLLFFCSLAFGQEKLPVEYFDNIKKADAHYQSKDYKKAAFSFSSAFKSNGWKGTPNDRWNAACCWSLAKIPDSAFFNLFRLANKMQFTDINRLITDTDLNSLHADKRWQTLLEVVQKNKDSSEVNFNKPVVRQLDSIFIDDQKYRMKMEEIEKNTYLSAEQKSKEQQAIWHIISTKDAINLVKVKAIIDKYGWLGPDEIGYQGNSTLFLVIQHSDQVTQEKYLPLMREAVKNKKASGADLALLEDRILLGQGKKQIYGSQLSMDSRTGQYFLSPIEDEINVNKRRAEVGLEPIEEYVKHWGIKYKMADSYVSESSSPVRISIIIVSVIFVFLLSLLLYWLIKKRKNKKADQTADTVLDNNN